MQIETTITKRSSHIPTFTEIAIMKIAMLFFRTREDPAQE
jgi:hypothetical protein